MGKRKSYTVDQKVRAIARLRANGGSLNKTFIETGIDRKSLKRWLSQEDTLIEMSNKRTRKRVQYTKACKWPVLETEVIQWIPPSATLFC